MKKCINCLSEGEMDNIDGNMFECTECGYRFVFTEKVIKVI